MKKLSLSALVLCFCVFSLIAQDKPAFSSMDVFDLEWANDPQISPDGDWIVYGRGAMDIMNDRRTSQLWLMKTDGSLHQKLSHLDVRESNARWSPDGTRIAFTASTDQGSELYLYWVDTQKTARVSQLSASPSGLSWSPDGEWMAFSMFVPGSELSLVKPHKKPAGAKWAAAPRVTTRLKHEADGSGYLSPGFSHYFIMPADGGKARQITSGNFHHRGTPVWTKDGKSLLFSGNRNEDWEYDFRNSEIYKVSIKDGKYEQLTDRKGPDRGLVLSPDGKTIAYNGYDDKVQTYQMNHIYFMATDGSGKRMIKNPLDRSISGLSWAPDGKGLYFTFDDKGNTKLGYMDLAGKTRKVADDLGGTGVARPYGGGDYSISLNGAIVYNFTTPYHPGELAILRPGRTNFQQLTDLNSDLLGQRTLGKVEEFWWKSTVDQLDIQGWIVYPPDFDPNQQYPLLIENHGGPISNYGDRFSPEMQLYATAGFVVLYPNPRGSTSYGEAFGNLLYHNYPGDDYQDVMDGVDAILKKKFIAADSLFVTGGSAGGIMSAWMIGKNNRFRAAAVIKPVMNWISKTLTADNYYGYAYSRYPGQPWENPETYMKFSPVSLVGHIETPTLVMVGSNDRRTPLSEAKQLYHALKLRKIETALVEVPGAFHFIANRPSQLITKIEHIVAWFDRYR